MGSEQQSIRVSVCGNFQKEPRNLDGASEGGVQDSEGRFAFTCAFSVASLTQRQQSPPDRKSRDDGTPPSRPWPSSNTPPPPRSAARPNHPRSQSPPPPRRLASGLPARCGSFLEAPCPHRPLSLDSMFRGTDPSHQGPQSPEVHGAHPGPTAPPLPAGPCISILSPPALRGGPRDPPHPPGARSPSQQEERPRL